MIRANHKRVVEPTKKWLVLRSWQRPLVLMVGMVGLAMWFMEGAEITQYMRMENELNRMNQEIAQFEHMNSVLEEEIYLVQHDFFTLERLARERLGYVKEGEVVYQLGDAQ